MTDLGLQAAANVDTALNTLPYMMHYVTLYKGFDIILDHTARVPQPCTTDIILDHTARVPQSCTTPHALCAILCVVYSAWWPCQGTADWCVRSDNAMRREG